MLTTNSRRERCVSTREGAGEFSGAVREAAMIECRQERSSGRRNAMYGRRQYRLHRQAEVQTDTAASKYSIDLRTLFTGTWEGSI